MFSGKKITIMVAAVMFFLVVGNGVMAQDNESIGLDLSLGVTGTDLTGTAGAEINLGLAYGFTLWGYDVEVGIDTFDYAISDSSLAATIFYTFGAPIGESAFSYFSGGEYDIDISGGFTYSAVYALGATFAAEDVDAAAIEIDWTYFEDSVFSLIFDAVAGAGYEFDFGPAGGLALWADFTIGILDATSGIVSRFGLNSIDATLDYTYYITDMIPLTAGVELVLSPMENFEHELSASISAGIEL